MKRNRRITWLLTLLMFFSVFTGSMQMKMDVAAQGSINFTLKISVASGSTAPDHFGVEYAVVDEYGASVNGGSNGRVAGNANGSSASETYSDITGEYFKITVISAGKDIYYNGSVDNAWANGKTLSANELNGKELAFELADSQGTPVGNKENVNLTVTWTGNLEEIVVGGERISGSALSVGSKSFTELACDNDQIAVSICPVFTYAFSSIKINGVEQLSGSTTEDPFNFSISKTDQSLNIDVQTVSTGKHTIVWAYDDEFTSDARVDNGKVEIVGGADEVSERHYLAGTGAEVTVKLIPDYGYQVVGAKINNTQDLTAVANSTNVFKFTMPDTDVHFKGIFKKTNDKIVNNSSAVTTPTFTGRAVANGGGTARMTIDNASPSSTSNVDKEIDTNKQVKAINITMDQLFYKNSETDYWVNNKTTLSSPAQISLKVSQDATGYAVLRQHGDEVKEIPANYDSATQTLTFASAQYSVYTLVPLTTTNNNYVVESPKTEEPTNGKVSEPEKTEEVEEPVVDVKTISVDKSAVTKQAEESLSGNIFNMSACMTPKSFVTGIDQIIKKNPKYKTISVYTGKPICFSKYVLNEINKYKIDLVYYFMYKGHLYCVTIPAGTDVNVVIEKNGFAGPLYVGMKLGTTRLIR